MAVQVEVEELHASICNVCGAMPLPCDCGWPEKVRELVEAAAAVDDAWVWTDASEDQKSRLCRALEPWRQ